MFTCIELNKLSATPRINDISLALLMEYYEMFLNPFIYHYTVHDIDKQFDIELRFDHENFCHLLGIESIVKHNINRIDIQKYKGMLGWNNIKDGTLNFNTLKNINKKGFKNIKAKFVFFYLLPNLIQTPKAINYDKTKVIPVTDIKCKILFYDLINNAVIHLGIEPSSYAPYYVPRTFLIEKLTTTNDGNKYTNNQQVLSINIKNRIILL